MSGVPLALTWGWALGGIVLAGTGQYGCWMLVSGAATCMLIAHYLLSK